MDKKAIFEALRAPFPSSSVKWRVGLREGAMGQALPYIDSRDVQERLDSAVGPENWEVQMKPSSLGVVAGLRLNIEGNWVLKEDGAQVDHFRDSNGSSSAKELAVKGAFSDALKRAAVLWGVGRYLYAYKAEMVPITEDGLFVDPPSLPLSMLVEAERIALEQAQAEQSTQVSPEGQSDTSTEVSNEDGVATTDPVTASANAYAAAKSGDVDLSAENDSEASQAAPLDAQQSRIEAMADARAAEAASKAQAQAKAQDDAKAAEVAAKAEADAKAQADAKAAEAEAQAKAQADAKAAEAAAKAEAQAKAQAEANAAKAAAKAKAEADAKADADAKAAEAAAKAQVEAAQTAEAPAATQDDAPEAAGTKVWNGFNYSHLSVNTEEEEFLKDILDKVGMLSASMLTTYVNGTKVKQRLNETARLWVLDMIAQSDKAKKAA